MQDVQGCLGSDKLLQGLPSKAEFRRFAVFPQQQCHQGDAMIQFMYVCSCSVAQSCPTLCNPMDCSPQASLSMRFSRQESWSGLPFPSPRDLPAPGIKPVSPVPPALTGGFLCISFLKINSYLLEADRHLVKITVSGKASPWRSPPLTPTLFFLKSSCGF